MFDLATADHLGTYFNCLHYLVSEECRHKIKSIIRDWRSEFESGGILVVNFGIQSLTYTRPLCSNGPFVTMKSSGILLFRTQRESLIAGISGSYVYVDSTWEIRRVHMRDAQGEMDP